MNNEPNKPTELTEKELEGIVGGAVSTKCPIIIYRDITDRAPKKPSQPTTAK